MTLDSMIFVDIFAFHRRFLMHSGQNLIPCALSVQ
jgi:hypothetical protein